MDQIDARGLACPAPVLKTKDLVEKQNPKTLSVIVDSPAARENLVRFLESRGYTALVEEKDTVFTIFASLGDVPAPEKTLPKEKETGSRKIMILAATDRLGFGDDGLGKKLMASFLKTLGEMGPDLWRLVFVNNGVKLTVEGSDVLEDLKALEDEGLMILVCGTCLSHFDILDKKKVGQTTNMLDIVTAMQMADKVINL